MNRATTALVLGSALAGAACGDEPAPPVYSMATRLAEVEDLAIGISVWNERQETKIAVDIAGSNDLIELGPGFSIAVDDFRFEPGSPQVIHGSLDPSMPATPWIELVIPLAQQTPDAVLTITDGESTATVLLGDLLVPRIARWLEPADGVVRSGDEVAISWEPAGDVRTGAFAGYVLGLFEQGDVALTATPPDVLTGTLPVLPAGPEAAIGIGWQPPVVESACLHGRCRLTAHAAATLPATVAP
jgi:hypothetical protein